MKLTALVCAVVFSVVCFAATPHIGVMLSAGEGERVLTEGSAFSTASATSEANLDNGVALQFAPHSSGNVFSDHAVLDHGAAHVSRFEGYAFAAGGLTIEAETPATQAVIRMEAKKIQIASLGGSLKVSSNGVLLTRVKSGTRASFQNSGATTGASAGNGHHWSETKTWVVVITAIAATALAIGLTAKAEGKGL